jgi:energy-coupling factor transporter ATP-binding protein EcfA2/predicted transcriptional regulator
MALLNDILAWTESLPSWQRDACRRLLQKEAGLKDTDYSELYALLKMDNEIETENVVDSVPLAGEHLPIALGSGETVALVSMRELENVNRIRKDQTLGFSETGITVIYGGNGSGKSGYARVIKRACRARDQSEQIHPNANDSTAASKIPSAKFDIRVAGKTEEIAWSRDSTPPNRLSNISVFDSRCARSYITAEQDVAYLPYGLDIVENLANQVLPKLSEKLEAEIASINVDTLLFQHLMGKTKVGKMVENLSGNSETLAIVSLGTLTQDETRRIVELQDLLMESNPLEKSKEFRLSALRLKTYAGKLIEPLFWVGNDAVKNLRVIADERNVAEDAEVKAAEKLRSGEVLLPGTGDQAWKLLFEAARRYATESAYRGEALPSSTGGEVCPLCQEELSESGAQRLKRFEEYIQNNVAKTADTARRKLEIAKSKIASADLNVIPEEALKHEIMALDPSMLQMIGCFQISIESQRTSMLNCIESLKWEEIPSLSESPRARVRQAAAQQFKAYRMLEKAANEDNRKTLEDEFRELSARKNLAQCLQAIIDLVKRMKKKAALEKCRSSLKTRPISDKSKELATAYVTEELRKALDAEFTSLGLSHIKTKLKERSVRGKMLHQLLLDLPTTNRIEEILSEGEQRVIALASFFAELTLANHQSGIIFDDPVSSLDHWRRRNVARRLIKEARIRQVIVFTHDTSFLGELCDEIEAAAIPNSMSFLQWTNGFPGCVNRGLPWDHQGYKARINDLEQAQNTLAKAWPAYPGEKEISEIRHQYDRLRATLERVIQDVVFNGVVKRYRDWIRLDALADVVGFDYAENQAIQNLHKRSCDVVTAHDPSSAKAATIPSAIDLGNDIGALKAIVDNIKNRRAASKANT